MKGIEPAGHSGGHDKFVTRMGLSTKLLGNVMGIGVVIGVAMVIAADLIFSPIFFFAQAKANGYTIGAPWSSFSWWIVIIMTIATSGILYALMGGKHKKGESGLGRKLAILIAVLDTLLDGAGFAAWCNHGDLFSFEGDATDLTFGLLPAPDSGFIVWSLWGIIIGLCFAHEPFLDVALRRDKFEYDPSKSEGANLYRSWVRRAGELDNLIKWLCLTLAPWCMMFMDGCLGPQGANNNNGATKFAWWIATGLLMFVSMLLWDAWRNVQEQELKFSMLTLKYKAIFGGALFFTFFDSICDWRGLNEALFNSSSFLPPQVLEMGPTVLTPYLMTAAMVLIICTAFEPLNAEMFLHYLKSGLGMGNGGGGLPEDFGGGIPPNMGGLPPSMGDVPPNIIGGEMPTVGPGPTIGQMPPGDDDPFAGGGLKF